MHEIELLGMPMTNRDGINRTSRACPNCFGLIGNLPTNQGEAVIKCPDCGRQWDWAPECRPGDGPAADRLWTLSHHADKQFEAIDSQAVVPPANSGQAATPSDAPRPSYLHRLLTWFDQADPEAPLYFLWLATKAKEELYPAITVMPPLPHNSPPPTPSKSPPLIIDQESHNCPPPTPSKSPPLIIDQESHNCPPPTPRPSKSVPSNIDQESRKSPPPRPKPPSTIIDQKSPYKIGQVVTLIFPNAGGFHESDWIYSGEVATICRVYEAGYAFYDVRLHSTGGIFPGLTAENFRRH